MMALAATHRRDRPLVDLDLVEWEQVNPTDRQGLLRNLSFDGMPQARVHARALRGYIDIQELREGLSVQTGAYVGRIEIGPLRIIIRPKLPQLQLGVLLRYAYDLRNLTIHAAVDADTEIGGMPDLLATQLAWEVEELLRGGLALHYVALEDTLASPRGKPDIRRIARRGGLVEARMPCRYHARHVEWHLNRVLRAGLILAAGVAYAPALQRRLRRIAAAFEEAGPLIRVDRRALEIAVQRLTRLTANYKPALRLIGLLYEMAGIGLDSSSPEVRIPGFLFDMNRFFQTLLARFLAKYVSPQRIVDEKTLAGVLTYAPGGNPRYRADPAPRPDYALIEAGVAQLYLDAKYRDLWHAGPPAGWLYQLSIYALGASKRTSILLYASMTSTAREERIRIRDAFNSDNVGNGTVVIRPVSMPILAELLSPAGFSSRYLQRVELAKQLIAD